MFKGKKLIKGLAIVGVVSSLLIGCTKQESQVEQLRLPSTEEAVNTFNKDNLESNISELVRLYSDVYVDYTGYDLATIEKILNKSRKEAEIIRSELVSMEDYNENIKKQQLKLHLKLIMRK